MGANDAFTVRHAVGDDRCDSGGRDALLRSGLDSDPGYRSRVVIVGAGFGGLAAARGLVGAPVDVLLLDRTNYHLFTPLLYQVATAGLEAESIAHPVRDILRGAPNVEFRLATVCGVDLERRVLITDAAPVPYDILILAAGSTTSFFGLDLPGVMSLKNLPEALDLRNHILCRCEAAVWERDPERRRALLTFVVVGGGPTGVEMAGTLAELVQVVLPRDFPMLDFRAARVVLLEATDRLLAAFRPRLQWAAAQVLRRKGVEVWLSAKVERVEGEWIELAGGRRIRTGTLIWAAGVRAADLATRVGAAQGHQGRLITDRFLRLPSHPEVFVIGDMSGFEQNGQPLPMLAPVAIQQGRYVARVVRRLVAGQALRPFRYRDRGIMATIGRQAAVAQIGPIGLSGLIAWLAWLALHLVWLIGFRNRLIVLINWMWSYLRYDQAIRIITSLPTREEPAAKQRAPAPAATAADDVARTDAGGE